MAEAPTHSDIGPGGGADYVVGNDALIADALKTLGDPIKRKRMKPTLVSVQRLTKLSINTIRKRDWALKAIADLKMAAREEKQASPAGGKLDDGEPTINPEVLLSRRLEGLLKQNGLLYEEILCLRRELRKRDETIEKFQGSRLRSL